MVINNMVNIIIDSYENNNLNYSTTGGMFNFCDAVVGIPNHSIGIIIKSKNFYRCMINNHIHSIYVYNNKQYINKTLFTTNDPYDFGAHRELINSGKVDAYYYCNNDTFYIKFGNMNIYDVFKYDENIHIDMRIFNEINNSKLYSIGYYIQQCF